MSAGDGSHAQINEGFPDDPVDRRKAMTGFIEVDTTEATEGTARATEAAARADLSLKDSGATTAVKARHSNGDGDGNGNGDGDGNGDKAAGTGAGGVSAATSATSAVGKAVSKTVGGFHVFRFRDEVTEATTALGGNRLNHKKCKVSDAVREHKVSDQRTHAKCENHCVNYNYYILEDDFDCGCYASCREWDAPTTAPPTAPPTAPSTAVAPSPSPLTVLRWETSSGKRWKTEAAARTELADAAAAATNAVGGAGGGAGSSIGAPLVKSAATKERDATFLQGISQCKLIIDQAQNKSFDAKEALNRIGKRCEPQMKNSKAAFERAQAGAVRGEALVKKARDARAFARKSRVASQVAKATLRSNQINASLADAMYQLELAKGMRDPQRSIAIPSLESKVAHLILSRDAASEGLQQVEGALDAEERLDEVKKQVSELHPKLGLAQLGRAALIAAKEMGKATSDLASANETAVKALDAYQAAAKVCY